ncbi:hypothetical protein [Tautonia marina]|uniref:hypothetical protein n=1 Tax=Tautonia marina TaxID=2653855 RepID=UPI0013760C60|nr:hypothetical protein [Tautonia marina]
MDATRSRRKRDPARRAWYARYRQWRFARHYGFLATISKPVPNEMLDRSQLGGGSVS